MVKRLVALGVFVSGAALASASPDPAPPALRLPATASPTGYRVVLAIDPAKATFEGSVDIGIRLAQPTELLWLHGTDLKIGKATARSRSGGALPLRVVPGGEDFVGFAFERAVPAGEIDLHVDYTGSIDETSTQGIFRQKDGDAWYVYTQLETTDARRAFPCFDEPAYKTPWDLTLTIPAGTSAVSNTPIASEAPAPGDGKSVRFVRTEPLPAYLIAFGVGPFDYVDAGRAGMKKTPIRIIVPKGKAARARYAAETSGPILEKIENYFGMPFPFAKLDQLVIPQTVTFSAMENAGLVTWSESVLLALPQDETIKWRRLQASINAHEIAHQWFGDYVTLAWWDDVWLNESFATWLADRTIQEWQPSWGVAVDRIVDRSNVMADDTLVSARKIRQEIRSADDIHNAFDSISYQKGGAVISMFEAWIGPAKFQAGVRRYMKAHAYGTGTSKDFLAAIEAESRPGVAAAFSTFLDQPGVPLVDASLQCGGEGGAKLSGSPVLALAQKRFLPVGSEGSAAQTWRVPVCVRAASPGGGEPARACALLTESSGAMPVPGASGGCPAWVLANDGELGYYRAAYRGDGLEKLLAVADRELSVPERVGLLRDIDALAMGGAIPMGQALALAPRFAGDPDRQIVQATIRIVSDAGESVLPESMRPAYARYVSKTFGQRARELGFAGKPGEDDDTRLLRASLVPWVTEAGDEPALQAEAKRLALAWLADRSAVEAEMVGGVLESAARHGDRALFEKYKEGIKASKERRDRNRLFRALGAFTDPAILADAFRFAMGPEFDSREGGNIAYTSLQTPEGRAATWEFLQANYDATLARMPREVTGVMPYYASGFCDEKHRGEVAEFFEGRAEKLPGGTRNLAKVLEEMDLCIALRGAQEGSLKEELARY
jgi:alanyl aminopeptidase